MTGNCIFCNLPDNRKSFETDNFVVVIGKSIITEGHCMIIPKKHFDCIGAIDNCLDDEYLFLKNKVFNFIAKHFYQPFMVEYGVFGQSVFHAHIHFIPSKSERYDTVNIIDDLMFPAIKKHNFKYFEFESFEFLKEFYKKYKQYVYFEQNNKKFLIQTNDYNINEVDADISYRSFFTKLGMIGVGDWATMTEQDEIIDLEKIKKTEKIMSLM